MNKNGKCAILYSQMEARYLQIFTNVRHSEQQFGQHIGPKVNSEMIRWFLIKIAGNMGYSLLIDAHELLTIYKKFLKNSVWK